MRTLVFDTETTGLPLFKEPSEHPGQPHLVQLAAYLMDDGTEVDACDVIVKPDGWTIPDELAALHGISTERALAEGEPLEGVIGKFLMMADNADMLSAFGFDFDRRIMRIAMLRAGMDKPNIDAWGARFKTFCVMRAATPLCKLPPTDAMMAAGRKTFKTPKLAEAVECLLGEKLEGAHNALHDVRATVRLHYLLHGLPAPTFKDQTA
jgi:DNA polymerase-3 subunit epsilon